MTITFVTLFVAYLAGFGTSIVVLVLLANTLHPYTPGDSLSKHREDDPQ